MKIYISGPIAGCQNYLEIFEQAELSLKKSGYECVNPAALGQKLCHERRKEGLSEPRWADYMRADIAALMECDAVLAVGDFWHSRGAMVELRVAEAIGMPIYQMVNGVFSKPVVLGKAW